MTGAANELRGPPSVCSPAMKAACPTGQAQCCWISASQGLWFGSDSIGNPPPPRQAGRWKWWKSCGAAVTTVLTQCYRLPGLGSDRQLAESTSTLQGGGRREHLLLLASRYIQSRGPCQASRRMLFCGGGAAEGVPLVPLGSPELLQRDLPCPACCMCISPRLQLATS